MTSCSSGLTPLMRACIFGYHDVLSLLIEKLPGEPATTCTNSPANSIFMAACDMNPRDQHIMAQTTTGHTALMFACLHGHIRCARLILKHSNHATQGKSKDTGSTALMLACQEGHIDVSGHHHRFQMRSCESLD